MLRVLLATAAFAIALAAPISFEAIEFDAASDLAFDRAFDPTAVFAFAADGRQLAEDEYELMSITEPAGRQLAETATPTATKKVAGASGPGQMGISSLRYKLSQSFCPSADDASKTLLACKNYEISHAIRATKETAEKAKLGEQRKALYAEAAKKSDAEKKQAAADHKQLYSKAFAKYCVGAPTSDVCTNELMKKMYGSAKPVGAKKAKKKKMA